MNILDYIEGNLQNSEIDAVVLARVAYLPFKRISTRPFLTMKAVAKKMAGLSEEEFLWSEDKELIRLLGESPRFSEMRISDFKERSDAKRVEQFAAVTIHISRREMFISFRGTDDSLHGWKEDFNMAIMKEVPSQGEALKYVRRVARKFAWKRFYLGGHSKGGNLALYSAALLPDGLQRRIIAGLNLDGPGLHLEVVKRDIGESVLPKLKSYIPQESVVGRLFEHLEEVQVIYSSEKGMMQHNLYSWEIRRGKLVPAEPSRKSLALDKAVTALTHDKSMKRKKIYVEKLWAVAEKELRKRGMIK